MLKYILFTFLSSALEDKKKERKKTLPCAENLGQLPRNLGDHWKIQIIRNPTFLSSDAGKSALGESRAVSEDRFLLGEHHWSLIRFKNKL